MQNLAKKFQSVQTQLQKNSWFKKEGWIISTHPFPKTKPDGLTFHIYKKNWFNEDSLGIHIESFLYLDSKKRKKSYITLHLLHHDQIPGTKLKRAHLSKPIVDQIYDEVSSWDGYAFRAGKYGLQPFTKTLDGTSDEFESQLVAEVSKVCKVVGPAVDAAIENTKS